jgi:hypothetical protein
VRTYPVEPWVVEDVWAALVEDDGAVALGRDEPPRLQEEAVAGVGGEGSPEAPRDGRHRRLVPVEASTDSSFLPTSEKGTRSSAP